MAFVVRTWICAFLLCSLLWFVRSYMYFLALRAKLLWGASTLSIFCTIMPWWNNMSHVQSPKAMELVVMMMAITKIPYVSKAVLDLALARASLRPHALQSLSPVLPWNRHWGGSGSPQDEQIRSIGVEKTKIFFFSFCLMFVFLDPWSYLLIDFGAFQ